MLIFVFEIVQNEQQMTKRFVFSIKGVLHAPSARGQSHFSKIKVKLAKRNEFVTHFVQKCLEMHKN